MRNIYLTLLLTLMMAPVSANNATHHSHADIYNSVEQFLEANLQRSNNIEVNTKISPLDSRLKLVKCGLPLSVFTTSDINARSRFSVGVKCSGQKPWSLYVTVTIEKIADLYITATPLARGDVITENDIQQVKRDINKLRRGFYRNKKDLIGMIAKRSMRVGTIISHTHLLPPLMIKKGDNVDIIAKTSSIMIRMSGVAMANGVKGQRIRVKNNSSRKIINATVITPGLVKVGI